MINAHYRPLFNLDLVFFGYSSPSSSFSKSIPMSWFGETNPHFWSSNQPQTPAPPNGPSGPAQQPSQQPPETIQPGRRIKPRERPDHGHVQSPPAPEPNPHFWPRDRRQAPIPPTDPHGPARHPPPGGIQPDKRMRPKERSDHVQPPPTLEPNPHFWHWDQPQAPVPPTDPRGPALVQHPPGDIQPEKRIRPKERPQLPPTQEPNTHYRPRDQTQAPLPPLGLRGPTRQPGQQSRPQAHKPELELELIPTFPTRKEDRSPLHPSQASQEHWPLHAEQASPEQSVQPRHQPKKQHPRIGPTKARPPRKHGPHEQPSKEDNLIYPPPSKTNPCTWCIAVLCVILWVVVILGGILILIFYLFYRPRNPHFEISNAALNAVYLDMGYLLNADVVLLINFTNPNEKMNVDFNFAVLKVLYENQPIVNQYIDSFSVPKSESKLATLEMVSSQIRLPVLVTQQLVKQIRNNRITFQVEGYFHARSRFGNIFRYSYWLYSHCTIVTTGPPSGILVASKCITKR